jgi:hypothetical protein
MEKAKLRKVIFIKRYEGIISGFKFSDLPNDLKPDDIIDLIKDEGHYSDNNSWDAFSELVVKRDRLETDEEFEKRKKFIEDKLRESKKARYNEYLKLKKEFENEIPD